MPSLSDRYCHEHDAPYEEMSGRYRCRKCNNRYQREYVRAKGGSVRKAKRTPEQSRRYNDKAKFGLTPEQSDEIRSRGKCDVCGESGGPKGLAIDHDHDCCPTQKTCGKCIRGLLCYHCNLILGHSKDSPELLRQLADYLERDR